MRKTNWYRVIATLSAVLVLTFVVTTWQRQVKAARLPIGRMERIAGSCNFDSDLGPEGMSVHSARDGARRESALQSDQ